MHANQVGVLLFAAAGFMCTAHNVSASPVLYASSDPSTSSGTELYVIDPFEATITVVRGVAGGGASGGFGAFGGGGSGGGSGGSGSDSGNAGTGGGIGSVGGGSFATASATQTPSGPSFLSTEPNTFPETPTLSPPTDQNTMIVFAPDPSPAFRDPRDLPGEQLPNIDCVTNCGGSGPAGGGTPGGDSPSFGPAALQIAQVPEPASLALLGIALASLGFARRRRTS